MKIAIFLQDLNSGGAEKIMVNYANFLANHRNDEVYLIVVRNIGPYKSLVNDKVHILDLNTKKTALSLFQLLRALRNNKIDVLYSTLVNANILALIAGKMLGINVIIREANTISHNRTNEKRILIKTAHFLSKYIYGWSFKCIAISRAVKTDLERFTNCKENKIEVLYNPIIPIDKLDIKLDINKFHVAIVSRLTVQKNIGTLIEIIKEVIRDQPNIVFHIFGEGDSKNIEELINDSKRTDQIILHGFNISYLSFVKNMNIFIHIPYWEGLGNSVLEVFNVGIPMILSNVESGYSELIHKNYPNVHYFNPNDKDGIVKTLLKYFSKEILSSSGRPKLLLNSNETYERYRALADQ